jgi:hypothetical protein
MSTRSARSSRFRSRPAVVSASGDPGAQQGEHMDGAKAAALHAAAPGRPRDQRCVDAGSAWCCMTPGAGGQVEARHGARRVLLYAIASVLATVVMTACSSSSKPHTQTPPSSSTQRSSDTSSPSSTPAAPVTASSSDVASHPATATTASSAAGSATESAVQAYLAYNTWVNHAAMNPDDPNVAELAHLASGAAYSDSLKNLNSSIVWRGVPATPRVHVTSVQFSNTVVNLTDCAAPGSLLPYYVATGKAVPLQSNSVPPPYPTSVQVVNVKGHWSVAKADTDRSRTCTS